MKLILTHALPVLDASTGPYFIHGPRALGAVWKEAEWKALKS